MQDLHRTTLCQNGLYDLSMWNSDFSQIVPGYDLERLNKLELRMLEALKYDMKVPAGQYAKYYFILRTMADDLRNEKSAALA